MIACSVSIPLLKNFTARYSRSKKAAVLFVVAINSISAYQWITTTKLAWFEDYFVQIVTGALGGSLIQQYVFLLLVLILRERMKPGRAFHKLKLPKMKKE